MIKDRKRLLFTCENRQEVEALIPIAAEIEKLSCGKVQCEFASQDAFYCQGVDDALQEAGVQISSLPYPIHLTKPFAFNSLSRKLRALLTTNREIAPVMQDYDGVVCGVDSAPARMLIAAAHRLGKPAFQIIISLYLGSKTNQSLRDQYSTRIKHSIKVGLGQFLGADFLTVPTGIARSGCDRVFVMGKRVKSALIRDGLPEEYVLAYGVPRFARLFELAKEASRCPASQHGSINILYIPGAFASHGASKQHRLQQRQLREIAEYLYQDSAGRYQLIVKMHPREREEYYTWMTKYEEHVQILPSNVDLYKAILDSYVVVTICSTVSYEAVLVKRPVVIARFPDQELLGFESLVGDFERANSMQELMGIIAAISNDNSLYAKLVETERESLYEVIDSKTPQSAALIARQICFDMEVACV